MCVSALPGSAQHLPRAVGRLRSPTSDTRGATRASAAAGGTGVATTTGVAQETLQTQRGRVAWNVKNGELTLPETNIAHENHHLSWEIP